MENPFGSSEEGAEEVASTEVAQPLPSLTVPEEDKSVVVETKEPEEAVEMVEMVETVQEVKLPQKSARQMILEEHGGLESNIPINSAYWTMK